MAATHGGQLAEDQWLTGLVEVVVNASQAVLSIAETAVLLGFPHTDHYASCTNWSGQRDELFGLCLVLADCLKLMPLTITAFKLNVLFST